MNAIAAAVTAALLHSLWLGALIALFASVTLFVFRNRSANLRYAISVTALGLFAVLPVVTAWTLYRPVTPTDTSATGAGFAASVFVSTAGAVVDTASFRTQPLITWVLPMWALGVFVFSLRLLVACTRVSSMRRRGRDVETAILERARALAGRMGIRREFRVADVSVGGGPGVVGWLRPVVLLPSATVLGLTPEQLEAVLAHELAHIRRHDYLVNLVQMGIETLMFFNPAVWWISGRIRHERELCCDDAAIAVSGDPLGYARALTQLERLRLAPQPVLGAAGTALPDRIRRIVGLQRTQEAAPSRWPALAALAIALAGGFLTLESLEAQTEPVPAVPAPLPTELVSPAPAAPGPAPVPVPSVLTPPSPPAGPAPAPAPSSLPDPISVPDPVSLPDPIAVPAPTSPVPPLPVPQTGTVDAWVLFLNGDMKVMVGGGRADSESERPTAEDLGGGDVLWFRENGNGWVVRDPDVLDEVFRVFLLPLTTTRPETARTSPQSTPLLQQAQALRSLELAELERRNLETSELSLELARRNLDRARRLQEDELIARTQLEEAQASLRSAEARLIQQRAQLERAEAQLSSRNAAIEREEAMRRLQDSSRGIEEIFLRAFEAGLAEPAP